MGGGGGVVVFIGRLVPALAGSREGGKGVYRHKEDFEGVAHRRRTEPGREGGGTWMKMSGGRGLLEEDLCLGCGK